MRKYEERIHVRLKMDLFAYPHCAEKVDRITDVSVLSGLAESLSSCDVSAWLYNSRVCSVSLSSKSVVQTWLHFFSLLVCQHIVTSENDMSHSSSRDSMPLSSRNFKIVFKSPHHCILSWGNWIPSALLHVLFTINFAILPSVHNFP
jgi:hypothetical protein